MELSVKNYQDFEMPNGLAWSADMLFDGRKTGSVSQSGDGSANRYYFDARNDREQFNKSFVGEFKQTDAIEIAIQKAGF